MAIEDGKCLEIARLIHVCILQVYRLQTGGLMLPVSQRSVLRRTGATGRVLLGR